MARSRFRKLEPEKQERILEAAADEFAERGYDGASLNRIIERAEISKGAMYYYFEDKADLYSTVMERAVGRVLDELGGFSVEDLTAENFWPTFEAMTRQGVDYLEANEWYLKLARSYYRLRGRRGEDDPTAKMYEWGMRMTEDILHRGQELGLLRTDLPLSFLVELTMALGDAADRWLLDRWEELDDAEREGFAGANLDVFRRMLEARA